MASNGGVLPRTLNPSGANPAQHFEIPVVVLFYIGSLLFGTVVKEVVLEHQDTTVVAKTRHH